MNKPVYLVLSILELGKIGTYEFWFTLNKNMGKKSKIMLHVYRQLHSRHKRENIYAEISKEVEARFETSNYEFDRPLYKGKNKKVIGLMKGELGEKITEEFAALRVKAYSYLTDNNDEE